MSDINRTELVEDLIAAATAVRDGDASAADRLVILARQVRALDRGRSLYPGPTRLDLTELTRIEPGALDDSVIRRRAEVRWLLDNATAFAATGATIREVFESADVPVLDRLAGNCLAVIGDLDGNGVVLYAATKGGQAASILSAVRDRDGVEAARERALDRLVRGHRYPWEH